MSAPRVFISYSQDSEEHSDWVRALAQSLIENGVDVILDYWELQPGDDATLFMEKSVRDCDRVLVVITENYIAKAQNPRGGVGYERMIVSTELARNLSSSKFLPILRQAGATLPTFLGPRIYVDFTDDAELPRRLDELLRTIFKAPKHRRPPLGKNPFGASLQSGAKATDGAQTVEARKNAPRTMHWHRSVHKFVGNRLYFIFVKLQYAGADSRRNLVDVIKSSGIGDYVIYTLFSNWDLLIRVWASDIQVESLRTQIRNYNESNINQPPELVTVNVVDHFSTANTIPESSINAALSKTPLERLKEIDQQREASRHFNIAVSNGFLLDDTVRFDEERIQFFAVVRSMAIPNNNFNSNLKRIVLGSENLSNRTIFFTSGSSASALIKAQVAEFYEIGKFINELINGFGGTNIWTETMLVAHKDPAKSSRIDWHAAESFRFDADFKTEFPHLQEIDNVKIRAVQSHFAGIRDYLWLDRHAVFVNALRAYVQNSEDDLTRALHFFSSFEGELRRGLPQIAKDVFGEKWMERVDELKKSDDITNPLSKLVIGDLCKIYSRLIIDERIIEVSPIADEAAKRILLEVPVWRNRVAHNGARMDEFDEIFAFLRKFMPIYYRLIEKIDRYKPE